jgi:hypothetical protein
VILINLSNGAWCSSWPVCFGAVVSREAVRHHNKLLNLTIKKVKVNSGGSNAQVAVDLQMV